MIERVTVHIDGIDVPLKVIYEKRNSTRIALGKREVIMRLPSGLPQEEVAVYREKLIKWMYQLAKRKKGAFDRYKKLDYQNDDTLIVGSEKYLIKIKEADRKTSKGALKDGVITLVLSKYLNVGQRSEVVGKLLSKVVAADQLPEIEKRVRELNQQFFQKTIKRVKLEYTYAQLGSCSSKGVVNLSTRLLFAPPPVVDYLIIHELAHLIEPNHSARFWALVAKAMPSYKEKEAWLNEFNGQCYF